MVWSSDAINDTVLIYPNMANVSERRPITGRNERLAAEAALVSQNATKYWYLANGQAAIQEVCEAMLSQKYPAESSLPAPCSDEDFVLPDPGTKWSGDQMRRVVRDEASTVRTTALVSTADASVRRVDGAVHELHQRQYGKEPHFPQLGLRPE